MLKKFLNAHKNVYKIVLITIFFICTVIIMFVLHFYNEKNYQINIKESKGWFESAYIEFGNVDKVFKYEVYIKKSDSNKYVLLDDELVRQYKDNYVRADAVGLTPGEYNFKIKIKTIYGTYSKLSDNVIVDSYDRTGFSFVNGESNGAYKSDGTLKENTLVIYITEENKDSITCDIKISDDEKFEKSVGIINILDNYNKGYDNRPLDIRMIGKVTGSGIISNQEEDKVNVITVESENKNDNLRGITIEGIGKDTTSYNIQIRVKNTSNVEIRNIGFMLSNSKEKDSIEVIDSDHIWAHNIDFFYGMPRVDEKNQKKGDGSFDCKNTQYVTVSYNHFYNTGKTSLIGLNETKKDELYITFHHNWFDHVESRAPRVRFYSAHIYNNYYDNVTTYCIGATYGCSLFVEANYFEASNKQMVISGQGGEKNNLLSNEPGGIIKAYNNLIKNNYLKKYSNDNLIEFDAVFVENKDEKIDSSVTTLIGNNTYNNFDTSDIMYTYTAQSPEDAKYRVINNSGRINGGDIDYIFKDNKFYSKSVNIELKNILLNYNTKIKKIGGKV